MQRLLTIAEGWPSAPPGWPERMGLLGAIVDQAAQPGYDQPGVSRALEKTVQALNSPEFRHDRG